MLKIKRQGLKEGVKVNTFYQYFFGSNNAPVSLTLPQIFLVTSADISTLIIVIMYECV